MFKTLPILSVLCVCFAEDTSKIVEKEPILTITEELNVRAGSNQFKPSHVWISNYSFLAIDPIIWLRNEECYLNRDQITRFHILLDLVSPCSVIKYYKEQCDYIWEKEVMDRLSTLYVKFWTNREQKTRDYNAKEA